MKKSPKKAGHRSWSLENGRVKGKHQGDIMSPETRSALMSRIKGKNTGPERILTSLLIEAGLSFESHVRSLPGRPDIVFHQEKVAVFIDGDFWHGWRFPLWKHKLSPKWQDKIEGNRLRDLRNHKALRKEGWLVIRIWEHQVESDPLRCLERITQAVARH